jgi:hypothetical protein
LDSLAPRWHRRLVSSNPFRAATVRADLELIASADARAHAAEHGLGRFVDWLERVNQELARSNAVKHVYICEQLIGQLRERIDRETGANHPTEVVRQGIGGVRSVLRAVRAKEIDLDEDLRADLVELVRDISAAVLSADLESGADSLEAAAQLAQPSPGLAPQ